MEAHGKPRSRCQQLHRYVRPGTSAIAVVEFPEGPSVGSVVKKRRKRMAKKKHRKLLKKTRIQRRRQGK